MNDNTDPETLLNDSIEQMIRSIADARAENTRLRNTIQDISERLAAALDAKNAAETEAKRSNDFLNTFRQDMEKLAAENAELRRDAERHRAGRSISRSIYGISEDAFDKSSDAAIDAVLKKETT